MELSPEIMQALASYGPFVLMIVIFYFLLYRPQKKEQQKKNDMLNSLKKGDRVVTIGGMYGTITALSEKTITLRVAEKVEIDFGRNAISHYQNPDKHN